MMGGTYDSEEYMNYAEFKTQGDHRMTDEPEITVEGYFQIVELDQYKNPRYFEGTSKKGTKWEGASGSISINFSTFDKKLIEQIKALDTKQQVRVTGTPDVRYKDGKRYWAIKASKIEDAKAIAAEKPTPPTDKPGTAEPDGDSFL